MATEETTEVTDQDVFNEAITPEPKAEKKPPPKEEAPAKEAKEETKAERERDEKGRFVGKQPDEPVIDPQPEQVAAPVVEQPKEEKPDHRIPLTELLNEREKRQNAERERAAFQQQLWQLQQQLQAQQKPEEPIDIFADPNAYTSHVQQTMDQRLRAMEGNFSLRLAAYKHGDEFHAAWQDMVSRTQNGDDSIRQQVLNSPDPGETLVQLYQREKVVKEVGTDPTAYRNKVLEEALKDPQFLAKALEQARGVASAQPTQKISLPPSLNKVAGSAHGDTDDSSDAGYYSYATR